MKTIYALFITLSILLLSCSSAPTRPFEYSKMNFDQKREFVWDIRACNAAISKQIYSKLKDTIESLIGEPVFFVSGRLVNNSHEKYSDQMGGFMMNTDSKNLDIGKMASIGILNSHNTGQIVYKIEFDLIDTLTFKISSVDIGK